MVLKVDVPSELIGGNVDEGYGPVADAFRANFASGQEIGAACAVYKDGDKVVDLWGGYRDGVARAPVCHVRREFLEWCLASCSAVKILIGKKRFWRISPYLQEVLTRAGKP